MSLISHFFMVSASFGVLAIYLTFFLVKKGVPESISATYYSSFPKWVFPASLALAGGLILAPWIELSQKTEFCAFIATASVFFVACSPTFKEKFVGNIHYGSAFVLFISAMIWLFFNDGFMLPFFISLVLALLNRVNWLFWVEIGLLLSIYATLLITISQLILYI